MMLALMRMPTYSNSAEYADNRISLFSAQWGKCAVTGDEFSHIGEIHCHHKLPRHLGGDDSYGNLVLIKDAVHKLIHASNTETIHKYMDLLQLDSKRLAKVNNLRQLASMQPMLIHAQKPDATLVAGFNKWKNSFGRHVKKGEKGIQILAPTPYKIKQEEQKLDPDTKLPLLDENGEPVTEEKEVTIPMFKVVSVFDVSQTDGRPLPQISSTLTGDVAEYEVFLEALHRTSPVPISFQAMEPGMDGYFAPKKQKIFLREGMSQVQTICAAVHEIAHSKLHDYEHMTELADDGETILVPGEKSRNTEEVEAESVSYAVCQYFGIETAENSFGYIAAWSQGKELKELRASLETINKTSSELITGIEKHYREICKERGIQTETQEQDTTTSPEVSPPESAPGTVPPPAPPKEQKPDYSLPLPDPTITPHMAEQCGYTIPDMYPLSKDRAMELLEKDVVIFTLYPDKPAEMVFDAEDIISHDGIFGITCEDWQNIHDTIPARDVHRRFLEAPGDAFAVMQLKGSAPAELRYTGLNYLSQPPAPGNYDILYTVPIACTQNQSATLENLFEIFNINRPGDFTGHSLSVSDIIALKQDGVVSYHYCDSVGFQELPSFMSENYLKAAEMSLEDDYGMIDGIINNGQKPTVSDLEQQVKNGQSISLMDLVGAIAGEEALCPKKTQRTAAEVRKQTQTAKNQRKGDLTMDFTFEEQELMSIYNPGTRLGLIQALNEMRPYLAEDEQELRTLTDSAVYKLSRITDDAFEKLDLIPEF